MEIIDKRKKSYYRARNLHPHYEVRDLSWKTLLWMGAVIIFGLIAIVIALDEYFLLATESEIYESVLSAESTELVELREREQKQLRSYAVVDSPATIYRIPIDSAMQRIATEGLATGRSR